MEKERRRKRSLGEQMKILELLVSEQARIILDLTEKLEGYEVIQCILEDVLVAADSWSREASSEVTTLQKGVNNYESGKSNI